METETILYEGKTKIIRSVAGRDDAVILENKNDITAFDDPSKTKSFGTKAEYATNTTCRVFQLLKDALMPVAYEEQISPTEFLAPKCEMIPLEVVIRRYAVGSYLKRFPNIEDNPGAPLRFHDLKFELFLKTTQGKLELSNGEVINVDVSKGEEDPFIINPFDDRWILYHSKKPSWDP